LTERAVELTFDEFFDFQRLREIPLDINDF